MTIEFIGDHVSAPALFGQILEEEGLEAVVALVRVAGCWYTTWTSNVDNASISMAALKLTADVQANMHGEPLNWSPREKGKA